MLSAEFPAAYVREARVCCESLLSYRRLAAKAFDALPGRTAALAARRSDGDAVAQPLMGLILEEEEDPTCSSLLAPLAGPLAVFFADVGTTLSAAAKDAQSRDVRSSAPLDDGDADGSSRAFLEAYAHVCRLLQPNRIRNPHRPLMSNVEVEAVNAAVFCLHRAAGAAKQIVVSVGKLREYDRLHDGKAQREEVPHFSDAPDTQRDWALRRQEKLAFFAANGFDGDSAATVAIASRLPKTGASVLVTATGPDRVGIASDITQVISREEASVAESRMLRLGGDFCITIVAWSDSDEVLVALRDALHAVSSPDPWSNRPAGSIGLHIVTKALKSVGANELEPEGSAPTATGSLSGTFHFLAPDRAGLVFAFTSCLARHGVSIERMETKQLPDIAEVTHFLIKGSAIADLGTYCMFFDFCKPCRVSGVKAKFLYVSCYLILV